MNQDNAKCLAMNNGLDDQLMIRMIYNGSYWQLFICENKIQA